MGQLCSSSSTRTSRKTSAAINGSKKKKKSDLLLMVTEVQSSLEFVLKVPPLSKHFLKTLLEMGM